MALAFAKARQWPDNIKLSFNLSAVQLCSSGSATTVLRALQEAALDTGRLQFEVTETALLADFEQARENLDELECRSDDRARRLRRGLCFDRLVARLHFDQVKLDGGLVTAAQHSADGKRLLRAVVGLCEFSAYPASLSMSKASTYWRSSSISAARQDRVSG